MILRLPSDTYAAGLQMQIRLVLLGDDMGVQDGTQRGLRPLGATKGMAAEEVMRFPEKVSDELHEDGSKRIL